MKVTVFLLGIGMIPLLLGGWVASYATIQLDITPLPAALAFNQAAGANAQNGSVPEGQAEEEPSTGDILSVAPLSGPPVSGSSEPEVEGAATTSATLALTASRLAGPPLPESTSASTTTIIGTEQTDSGGNGPPGGAVGGDTMTPDEVFLEAIEQELEELESLDQDFPDL